MNVHSLGVLVSRVLGAGCRVLGALCLVPIADAWSGGRAVASATGMGARRYHDLVAWALADELKKKVYELVERSSARSDRNFCDQIKNSASSSPSNIAEGFGCYRHAEFARYVRIAKSSATETHNHLGDGADRGHWSPQAANEAQQLADRAIGAATRLLQYLMTTETPPRGPKKR